MDSNQVVSHLINAASTAIRNQTNINQNQDSDSDFDDVISFTRNQFRPTPRANSRGRRKNSKEKVVILLRRSGVDLFPSKNDINFFDEHGFGKFFTFPN